MRSLGDLDPRRVGVYRLVGRLEVDELGPVLLGVAADGRLLAVKLVSSRLVLGDGPAALWQVTGPHVARVVDAGPTEASPWVAAEFVPGVSLRELVERGLLLGEADLLRLAEGLVAALTELHRVGLMHRELTPVNVWLVDGGVRVFDFGVEQAQAGVHSLGAVLHLAVTGRPVQAELSPSLPPRVRRLLAACLAGEPLHQVRALIGPTPPGPWPSLVRAMIDEQRAEVARLTTVDAPTVRIAVRPRKKPAPKRWRPDKWAVFSAAAVVLTIVFALVMFNSLTPDEPVRASPTGTGETGTGTTVTTTTTTMTTTTTEPQPPYGEITGLAGKCMDIAGASTGNGTPVQLHECNGTSAQEWELSPDGTVQALGKCLDVTGGATNDGATVQIYDCNGTGAQQWGVTPDGSIINAQSGKCLDVPAKATADGTQLIIWTCHGEENQRWTPPA